MRIISFSAWPVVAPIAAWIVLGGLALDLGGWYQGAELCAVIACVLAGVHHAEVVSCRVGEPFGTLVLAIAITVIEVALILTLMLAGGKTASALARDTVFAAVMITLNGIVGICLLAGGTRYREQEFGQHGTSAALTTLAAISVLTLVLPNFTETTPGPFYSRSQLVFIALVTVALYGTFVLVQTVRHRDYFLPASEHEEHAAVPSTRAAAWSFLLMLASLAAVVVGAKALAPSAEKMIEALGAPPAGVGVLIALVVMMPEGFAALRSALANRMQTSLNLALGSALASIGLSIPTVAILSIATGTTLTLGLGAKETALLLLSLFVTALSLSTGRTTIMQGAVHVVLFGVYLFVTVVP